jgi:hypothetical protein
MIKDHVKVTGALTIQRYNEKGELTLEQFEDNLVVNAGKAFIAGRMGSSPPAVMTHMAIGAPSFVPSPLPQDTALSTELARVVMAPAGGTSSNNTVSYVGVFPAGTGTNSAITEAGIFSASSGGNMLCRTTFVGISKLITDTIVITWIITIS